MKVVSRGIPPELQQYTTTCSNCRSVLEFQKNEARVMSDRNETVYVLNCPVCNEEIWIASQALRPVQILRSTQETDFRDRPFNPK
jgi:RNase P subunit RPR2